MFVPLLHLSFQASCGITQDAQLGKDLIFFFFLLVAYIAPSSTLKASQ